MRWTPIATLLLLGCSADSEVAGTPGQSGEGVFRYECLDNGVGDPRCNDSSALNQLSLTELGIEPELPGAVAVGSHFGLTYLGDTTTDQGEFLGVDIVPARTDLVVTGDGGFAIMEPGRYSFLARSTSRVLDFVNLTAAEPAGVVLWSSETTVDALMVNETLFVEVAVVTVDADGKALAGSRDYTWSTDDETVVAIEEVGGGSAVVNVDEARLVGETAGNATVTVTSGEYSADVTVTVNPP